MKLKVCGMKLNTAEVAQLRPDYLGFIFWEKSSRFFNGEIPPLPSSIKKIGVFVDASIDEILQKIETYDLQGVQLHGNESPEFCKELRIKSRAPRQQADSDLNQLARPGISRQPASAVETYYPASASEGAVIKIIKVFSIKDDFDFRILKSYESVCDYFLFDTKGELPGGNGYAFDWKVLEDYPSTKPYFLSGGIGPDEVESIKEFLNRPEAKYCHAIDINSRFEIEPGLKDLKELKKFKKILNL